MRLTRTGKPDNFYYYVIEDYKNDKGQKKTRTVESLGCVCQSHKRKVRRG